MFEVSMPEIFPETAPGNFTWDEAMGKWVIEALDIAERSVLIGEQSFEYRRPLCAGDKVLVTRRLVDLYEKLGAGGSMDFAVIEDEGRDEKGETVYRARRTLIVRPPIPAAQLNLPAE